MQDELAAVCLRLRVELDWVEERLASQWAEALDDYCRQPVFTNTDTVKELNNYCRHRPIFIGTNLSEESTENY